MRLTEEEKRVIIPAIRKVGLIEGKYISIAKAIEILEEACEECGGVHHWNFVLWKREIKKKAQEPLIRL